MMRDGIRTLKRWCGRSFRQQALILLYHRVANISSDPWNLAVTPEHFEEHLEVLQRHAVPIPLKDLVGQVRSGRVRRGSVAVTFDDGYQDNFLAAKPLLESYGIPATIFVASGYMGGEREYWWDELEALLLSSNELPPAIHLRIESEERRWQLSAHPARTKPDAKSVLRVYQSIWRVLRPLPTQERERVLDQLREELDVSPFCRVTHRPMTAAEVAMLADGALMEIGAHSVSHPPLAHLPLYQQRKEIAKSVEALEDIIRRPVTSFAYPFGRPSSDYTPATAQLVRDLGLQCACSNFSGPVHAGSDPYQLRRVYVTDMEGDHFSRMLSKWMPLMSRQSTNGL